MSNSHTLSYSYTEISDISVPGITGVKDVKRLLSKIVTNSKATQAKSIDNGILLTIPQTMEQDRGEDVIGNTILGISYTGRLIIGSSVEAQNPNLDDFFTDITRLTQEAFKKYMTIYLASLGKVQGLLSNNEEQNSGNNIALGNDSLKTIIHGYGYSAHYLDLGTDNYGIGVPERVPGDDVEEFFTELQKRIGITPGENDELRFEDYNPSWSRLFSEYPQTFSRLVVTPNNPLRELSRLIEYDIDTILKN